MTLKRINLRLRKDNPDDIQAWNNICEYAKNNNCSLNKAIIGIINNSANKDNDFDINAVAYKLSEVLRTELDLSMLNTENETIDGLDTEGLNNLFEFIDML